MERREQRPNVRKRSRSSAIFLRPVALEAERVIPIGPDLTAIAEARFTRMAQLTVLAKGLRFVRGR
jgi:hypothetical protein